MRSLLRTRLAWTLSTLLVEVALVALGALTLATLGSPLVGPDEPFRASYLSLTQAVYDLTGSPALSHLVVAAAYFLRYTASFALALFGMR